MALLDQITRILALEPWHEPALQTRQEEFPTLEDQIARLRNTRTDPWRVPSISEALSVPAVFRAVTLISNTMGSLTLETFRDGALMAANDRPGLAKRPNPRQTPGDFVSETTFGMAAYGEAWWWTAKRDGDGIPISLFPVPPHEIVVRQSDKRLFPEIWWGDRRMANEDMTHLTLSRLPGELRGTGPLQACGAAISVAVESQRWAAKFFDSPTPSVNLHSDSEMTEQESKDLKLEYYERTDNLLVTSGPLQLREFGVNKQSAELLDSRFTSVGDVARAFGIPGPLLEFSLAGASLTYQNRDQLIRALVDQCLRPDYGEKMEQALSDLLTRSITARFNYDDQLRADIKTRFEVYELGVAKAGVMTVDEARALEGLAPGNVENAPVPFSPPQAQITALPVQMREDGPARCPSCGKARFTVSSLNPTVLRCVACKETTTVEQPIQTREERPIVVNVSPPVVNVTMPEMAAPVVNVSGPEIPKPADVHVSSNYASTDTFAEAVADLKEMLAAPKQLVRNEDGRIMGYRHLGKFVPVEEA
jgi:HK97 family phage portal protein